MLQAARALLLDEQICAIASQRMTVKGALLKVGSSQERINNNKHRHAVDRAKRRLSLHASLPLLVNIASPGDLSEITNTDTTATTTLATTALTKKEQKRKT